MDEKLSSSRQPVVLLRDIMKKKERKSLSYSTASNSVYETRPKRLRKCENGNDNPWEKFRKERELKKFNRDKREERRPFQCNKCLQFEDELYEFSSFDINAVEERIALDQDNEEIEIIELKEYKIKKFTVYDAVMHVCQLDKELIEKGLSLYLSGYVKPISDAKSDTDGIAVKNIGPLTDWWISYSNDDNDVMIGVSTDLAYYYLVTPSDEYRVYFFPLQEKSYLTNIIINSLEENECITYRDLVERVEATTLPYDIEDDIELSAKSLHYHLDFILDQLSDYDKSADDFDTVLMNTSCVEYLKELSGKVFAISQKYVIDSSNENTASEKRNSMIHKLPRERLRKRSKSVVEYKSINTKLVKMIFDNIFQDYTYSMNVSHQESNIHSEFSDTDDLFFSERDWTLDCSKKISVCYKNLITRNYDKSFYQTVEIRDEIYEVGECIFVQFTNNSSDFNYLVKIVTIYKSQDDGGIHVIFFTPASETILGKAANENEHFMLNRCMSLNFSAIKYKSDIQYKPPLDNWRIIGGQNLEEEGINNDGRRFYYSKSYHRTTCRFEDIEDKFLNPNGIICPNCILKEKKKQENTVILLGLKYNESSNGLIKYRSLMWMNETFQINDAIFLVPNAFEFNVIPRVNGRPFMHEVNDDIYPEYYRKAKTKTMDEVFKPYKIGEITEIYVRSMPNDDTNADDVRLRVKKFYRPENTHLGSAASYEADFNLLYSSDEVVTVRLSYVIGKCNVLQCTQNQAGLYDQKYFYFNQSYDACMEDFTTLETSFDSIPDVQVQNSITPLKTMDLFCGCGGLSEGLRQSGVAKTCWALDNDKLSTRAFKKNHPDCAVFTCDCNALLEWLMNGNEEQILPNKGEVDLLCGGPPCQGFSSLNKFNNRCCAKLKNSLVTTFLSLCDWLRPRFFLLENVQNFARTNDSMILKSTLRCLLTMGYQCAFAKLQAGNYGVPQRRTRIFILAAAPGERLPQFPEPSHIFDSNSLLVTTISQFKMIPRDNWPTCAPYRRVTVRDAIFDLADFYNGDDIQFYDPETQSHFQKIVRRNSESNYIYDHISQNFNPIITERIMHIPKERGADWRDLPNIEITLSNGIKTRKLEYEYEDIKNGRSKYGAFRGVCPCAAGKHENVACSLYRQNDTLIPWFLAHTANDNNQWNGAYGRLDYDDIFQTTLTKLTPGGKIGRVIHPEQDRILTVRECARAQGFPDSYEFCGEIADKIKQIGNAVPPMLARAIGCEIKKSLIQ